MCEAGQVELGSRNSHEEAWMKCAYTARHDEGRNDEGDEDALCCYMYPVNTKAVVEAHLESKLWGHEISWCVA
jgi:hypothetical protein